jgi:hypothetical protein
MSRVAMPFGLASRGPVMSSAVHVPKTFPEAQKTHSRIFASNLTRDRATPLDEKLYWEA